MKNINILSFKVKEKIITNKKKYLSVIYDITCTKRRNKIIKLLEQYGNRVQKSAFEILISEKEIKKLVSNIKEIIEVEDDVRIYKLNNQNEIISLGNNLYISEENVIIV